MILKENTTNMNVPVTIYMKDMVVAKLQTSSSITVKM